MMDERKQRQEEAGVEDVSALFKEVFLDQARSVRETGRCNLDSEIVQKWVKSVWQFNTENTTSIDSSLKVELTALNACSVAVGALASCVLSRDHFERPLPVTWGGKSHGEANFALWCLLTQYVNCSLSVVQLCQYGFESSAKIIVRTLLEMARILVVVAADSGYMQSYLNASKNSQGKSERKGKARTDERLNRHGWNEWKRKAGTDEVLKRLRKIECQIGLSEQWANYMLGKRNVAYSHLCLPAHANHQEMIECSFLPSHADDDQVKSTMFGAQSPGLKPSLEEAINTTLILLVELKTVFQSIHRFSATDRHDNWKNFEYLYSTMILIWLSYFTEGSTGDEPSEYLRRLGIDVEAQV